MRLVAGHDETVNAWLTKFYGVFVAQHPRQILGVVDRDGVLRGAFVLTSQSEASAELHVYGRTSNDTWKSLFALAFLDYGLSRLEVRTRRGNRTIKRNAPKFGFRFEGVARSHYGPGRTNDALVYGMTEDQCRWINHGLAVQVAESS